MSRREKEKSERLLLLSQVLFYAIYSEINSVREFNANALK
jgi:hypothetical protein